MLVAFSIDQGVGKIVLNRPDKYNSFNREMALTVQQHLDTCEEDEDVRVVLFTGTGKAFSAGQDLVEVLDPNGPELPKIVSDHYNPIIEKIRKLSKPVVCGVNGVAAGAGCNIALSCDMTIATSSAVFIQAFSKIGLIPDSGGTYFLPRLVGMQKAAALMFLGDKVSASEAAAMNMIYKVVSDEDFEQEVNKLVQKLAKMPTKAIGYTKQLLNASWDASLTKQLAMEGEFQEKSASTDDFAEGVQAFVEKRKPVFKGK